MDFKKITDRIFMTPNGIVDFDTKPELTPSQELHNSILDFEVAQAEREFQHRERMAKEMGTINMIGRRRVIGLKYKA
jgi:hypothetical protein